VHFLHCVLAEWQLVRVRLLRSRLGIWLLLLGVASVAVHLRARTQELESLALRVGMLGALLGIAFAAGSDADRAALAITLSHPTTPLAVALGRWLAAVTASACAMLAALVATVTIGRADGTDLLLAARTGALSSAAVAAAALAGVWLGGNTVAAALFLYIGLAGTPPVPGWAQVFVTVGGVAAGALLLMRRPHV